MNNYEPRRNRASANSSSSVNNYFMRISTKCISSNFCTDPYVYSQSTIQSTYPLLMQTSKLERFKTLVTVFKSCILFCYVFPFPKIQHQKTKITKSYIEIIQVSKFFQTFSSDTELAFVRSACTNTLSKIASPENFRKQ